MKTKKPSRIRKKFAHEKERKAVEAGEMEEGDATIFVKFKNRIVVERVYISGPMTGIKDNNFPAFYEAEKKLKAMGYKTVNPAKNVITVLQYPEWEDYISAAILSMKGCTCIYFLQGWENSYGARIEKLVAEKNGMKTIVLDPPIIELGQVREQKSDEETSRVICMLWFFVAISVLWAICAVIIWWCKRGL